MGNCGPWWSGGAQSVCKRREVSKPDGPGTHSDFRLPVRFIGRGFFSLRRSLSRIFGLRICCFSMSPTLTQWKDVSAQLLLFKQEKSPNRDANSLPQYSNTLLHYAVLKNQAEIVKQLLIEKVIITAVNCVSCPPLSEYRKNFLIAPLMLGWPFPKLRVSGRVSDRSTTTPHCTWLLKVAIP